MVFGFGFNKQKALGAAEKYVQQGKLPSAIAEYDKVIKADPKDLTVLNTIGDLHARQGDQEAAIECFKQVGDAYAGQGFTVKAIAVYKKISKIKPSLEGTLKLAELYTQQGLFNDARAQYLQVAEEFLRTGELEKAVRIFQKTLEMDPDNVAMKVRLGEVYVRLGKKSEAWKIFGEAVENLRSHGSLDAAEDILKRMFQLDPKNGDALLLRGRTAIENGDAAAAISFLEQVADIDQHPDALRDLQRAYVQVGRMPEAGVLATKLFKVHNDVQALSGYASALMSAGAYADALQVYQQHSDVLLAADSAKTIEDLHTIIGHVRENPDSLETLLALLQKAGDPTQTSDVMELLAHASVQSGDLVRARDLYLQLSTMEPQNTLHARNYQQIVAQLGSKGSTAPITSEEGTLMVDELEATAPVIDQLYPEQTKKAVRAALTDAELFVSYNMPEKALGPLLAALPLAPRDLRLNQRLVSLHTRTGRFAEAAMCCRTLQSVFSDAGYSDEAVSYGDLANKYEDRAALAAQVAALESAPGEAQADSAQTPWPAAVMPPFAPDAHAIDGPAEFAVEPAAIESAGDSGEVSAGESIDISDEWETSGAPDDSISSVEVSLPEQPDTAAETVNEIRFYLQNGMLDQARDAMAKLETITQDDATLAALRSEIADAIQQAAAAPTSDGPAPADVAEFEISDTDVAETVPEPAALEPAALESAPEHHAASPPVHHAPDTLSEFVAELEAELPADFLGSHAAAVSFEPAHPPALHPAEAPAAAASAHATQPVAGAPWPTATPAFSSAAAAAAPAFTSAELTAPAPVIASGPIIDSIAVDSTAKAAAGADLNDMFDELKAELEEDAKPFQEDAEDHYNLGVAFREMGLLDEAIGELQKVCQSIDRGQPFSQTIQAYTWLAQCFIDKNIPEAAIRWYEKALKIPALSDEARTALHYELAATYQLANNKRAALAHFMEVYGSNIDYRDVAERIQALKA